MDKLKFFSSAGVVVVLGRSFLSAASYILNLGISIIPKRLSVAVRCCFSLQSVITSSIEPPIKLRRRRAQFERPCQRPLWIGAIGPLLTLLKYTAIGSGSKVTWNLFWSRIVPEFVIHSCTAGGILFLLILLFIISAQPISSRVSLSGGFSPVCMLMWPLLLVLCCARLSRIFGSHRTASYLVLSLGL